MTYEKAAEHLILLNYLDDNSQVNDSHIKGLAQNFCYRSDTFLLLWSHGCLNFPISGGGEQSSCLSSLTKRSKNASLARVLLIFTTTPCPNSLAPSLAPRPPSLNSGHHQQPAASD